MTPIVSSFWRFTSLGIAFWSLGAIAIHRLKLFLFDRCVAALLQPW